MTFKQWLQERWFQHVDELQSWGEPVPSDYRLGDYFNKYRWWLRREYRFSLGIETKNKDEQ